MKPRFTARLIAANDDPIEKKPLFHVLPGSRSFSIATVGCNFKCRFCQNADIAQMPSDREGMIAGDPGTPEQVGGRRPEVGIAPPSPIPTPNRRLFFEFACDTAELAHAQGIKNVFVTNGFMSDAALDRISPFLDAANVDLKAYSDDFYNKTVRRTAGAGKGDPKADEGP